MRKVLLLLIIIIGCQKIDKKKNESDLFKGENVSKKDLLITSIKLDTLTFDTIESSYQGFFSIDEDRIDFIDRRFGWFFTFDKNGKLISKNLGQGGGPHEVNTGYIDAYTKLPNGKHVFIGSSFDVHIHDKDFEREKTFMMNWDLRTNENEINLNNLDPLNHRLYSPHYWNFDLQATSNSEVYFPIEAEHKVFNRLNSKKYYEEARIFAKLNLETGKIENLFGKKSREYLKYKYLGFYDTFDYEIDNEGKFYVSFEADSLIYLYDKNYVSLNTFGNSGRFNTKFVEYNSKKRKGFVNEINKHKNKTGYYKKIKLFKGQNLLFRGYNIPNKEDVDGLQIYRGTTLIADLDVPKWFEVVGYIEPYFYSQAVLSEDELTLKSYRFKLPKLKE